MSEQIATVIFAQAENLPLGEKSPLRGVEQGIAFERAFSVDLEAGAQGTSWELVHVANAELKLNLRVLHTKV